MESNNLIIHPDTLENGCRYLLRVRQENGRRPSYVLVTFVRYDACPTIVVVNDGDGRLLRIAREDLYACEITGKLNSR
jgi:hypothetical protein